MAIEVNVRDHVLSVALNRPRVRNALDQETSQELLDTFTNFSRNDELWVAVIGGNGDHFCAGADLHETKPIRHKLPEGGITRNFSTNKPIIAALQGVVFGGGLELALCADIRVADESAQLGQLEVRWGIMPGAGGTQRLPRLVGLGNALELIMTGDPVDASRALQMGLVNRVVPAGTARSAALDLADRLCERAPLAVRRAKEATMRGLTMPLDDGLRMETLVANLLAGTNDIREGRTAFREKRPPKFTAS